MLKWSLLIGFALLWPAPVQSAPLSRFLQEATRSQPAVRAAVLGLVGDTATDGDAGLLLISYRQHGGQIADVVVQLYPVPPADVVSILNPQGTVRGRFGDDLGDSADELLTLLAAPAKTWGRPIEVQRRQRALQAAFNGDLTLLREQTVDPLHIIAVLPDAGRFLPASLAGRVRRIVISAQLNFGRWAGTVGLLTDDVDEAAQVGNVVAAWRELAGSVAGTFAGDSSGRQLRRALQSARVEVLENEVVTTAEIPALTAVRVAKEIAGHGGGCPGGAPCAQNKVAVCHKEPGKPNQTLCVAPSAVPTHLSHGDTCGPCAGN